MNETYTTLRYYITEDGDFPTFVSKHSFNRVSFIDDYLNNRIPKVRKEIINEVMGLVNKPFPTTGGQVDIITSDGNILSSSTLGFFSELIQDVRDCTLEDGEPWYVPGVQTSTWFHIFDFCDHFYKEPMKAITLPVSEESVGEWYNHFIDLSKSELFELVRAAVYLRISPLIDLTCFQIAKQIQELNTEQLIQYSK